MKIKTLLLFLFATLSAKAASENWYVVHSSMNILGLGSDNRASILAPGNAAVQPLRFKELSDGSFLIALDRKNETTLYLSLGTANAWSTYFVTDSTDTRAHYKIEKQGEQYVKLKNMNTGQYLGTDNNDAGSYTYSNKNGTDAKHLWVLSETKEVVIVPDEINYPICIGAPRQLNEGWGVSLCWWAGQCGKWSDTKINQLVDWLVSPTGLNMNIFRYNIGGGDDPNWTNCTEHHMGSGKGLRAEMEGFQDERGGEYHWERDEAQRKIMLKIKEKRPDAIFEAFSNSAPWWMTVSGCVAGNTDGGKDNLNPAYYEDFARYLVDVCKHYKEEYGIEFKTLEPFNEANTSYWHQSGVQEGCHFDNKSQIAFLKVLAPILKESGLSTMISASDETSVGLSIGTLKDYISDGIIKEVGQWNTHTYGADNRSRSQVGTLARTQGKTMWMSETGAGGSGIGGNLSMAQRLFDDVRYIAPSAWIDWQYMEEANDQWCTVRGSFADASFYKVKNYYVRQHVTRFIKKGYTFVTSLNEQSLAAINPTCDTLVVALINTSGTSAEHHISLPMARMVKTPKMYRTSETENLVVKTGIKKDTDSTLTVSLPSNTISTLVIPIEAKAEITEELSSDDRYLIVPQSNVQVAVCTSGGTLFTAKQNIDDPAQRWTIVGKGNKGIRLRNENGEYACYSTSYAISTSTKQTSTGQLFDIVDIDGLNCKIMQSGKEKGWDLEQNNLSAGAKVGVYTYGDSPAADTRNWQLVRISAPASEETDIVLSPVTVTTATPAIYDLNGRQQKQMHQGINIVRQADGTYKKVLLK